VNTLRFLQQFYAISPGDFELLAACFKPRQFSKGEIIISPGQVQREVLFVEEGIQMSYYESETKHHVIAFTYPPNLCAIPESFCFQLPSKHYLKCMTDSRFSSISFDDLQKIFASSQIMERLFRKLAEAMLAGLINRHVELHALTMEERYLAFCTRSAHLLHIIPHKYIASYLAIDPTNFSKLYNTVKI
jgi:CRP-like cAMP-binding protein